MSKTTHRITLPAGTTINDAITGQPGPRLAGPLTVDAAVRGQFGTWLFDYGQPPAPYEVGPEVPAAAVPLDTERTQANRKNKIQACGS